METNRPESRGFTLLESMIALVILTIGLLGLAQLFVVAINQNAYGRQNTMAISVAVDKMETLKNQYNDDLKTGIPSTALLPGNHGPETVSLQGAAGSNEGIFKYNVTWTVTQPSGLEKGITVVVTPSFSNIKQNRSVQLTSYLTP